MKRGPKGPRQTADNRNFGLWLQVDTVRAALRCSTYRAVKTLCEAKGPLEIPFMQDGMPAVLRIERPATLDGRRAAQTRETVRSIYRRYRARLRNLSETE